MNQHGRKVSRLSLGSQAWVGVSTTYDMEGCLAAHVATNSNGESAKHLTETTTCTAEMLYLGGNICTKCTAYKYNNIRPLVGHSAVRIFMSMSNRNAVSKDGKDTKEGVSRL